MGFYDDDTIFKRELFKGLEWEKWLAEQMEAQGFDVDLQHLPFRKTFADSKNFMDQQDLKVGKKDIKMFHLECKSRNIKFNSPKDYPFPTIIVDTKYGWDNKKSMPVGIVIISTITKKCIVVPTSTRTFWKTEKFHDRIRDIDDVNYIVDKKYARTFDELIAKMKERIDKITKEKETQENPTKIQNKISLEIRIFLCIIEIEEKNEKNNDVDSHI